MISGVATVAPPPQSPRSIASVLTLLLLAQTAASQPPLVVTVDSAGFDLAKLPARPSGCAADNGDDITVCARMTDLLPDIEKLDLLFRPKPFRPEFDVGGGKAAVRAEQRSLPGASAPALMMDFKLPF